PSAIVLSGTAFDTEIRVLLEVVTVTDWFWRSFTVSVVPLMAVICPFVPGKFRPVPLFAGLGVDGLLLALAAAGERLPPPASDLVTKNAATARITTPPTAAQRSQPGRWCSGAASSSVAGGSGGDGQGGGPALVIRPCNAKRLSAG